MLHVRDDLSPLRRRTLVLALIIAAVLGALELRFLDLQVISGRRWHRMAENNRLRKIPLPGPRGRIYDRNGRILADNQPSYRLLLYPAEARHIGETVLFLARLGIGSAAELNARIEAPGRQPLAPVAISSDLSWEEVTRIRARQTDHPELVIVRGFRRWYPEGKLTAHAIGHLRMVSRSELRAHPGLDPDTLVGATGVEALAQESLAGTPGERRVVVSAVGEVLGVLDETPPSPGHDLTLNLDLELQKAAAEALGDSSGAVVALDPRTGAIRAFYSSPSFDPNVFGGRLSTSAWAALRDDPEHPLQDRCIQGVYPPGSTIKPFYALAGLATGAITPQTRVYCRGFLTVYGHTFHCWRRGGHGSVDLTRSLESSCDVYYYTLGRRLGIETMAAWLRRFGFGSATGVGLPSERRGLVGTPEWSRTVRHRPWYPGTSISVAIGQGPLLATPLQLARAYAALANGGRLVTPKFFGAADQAPTDLHLAPDQLKAVVRGLVAVVHGVHGTARSLAALPVAGKTGTSQVARLREGVKAKDLERRLRHHALFVGWEPIDDPSLVVAVIVEHGASGGGRAAPAAGLLFAAGASLDSGPGRGPSLTGDAPPAAQVH